MKLLIVLAVTLIGTKVSMATDLVCTTGEAEIIFVLDIYGGVDFKHFLLQQKFAADVSAAFKVGPADTRFGALLYSHETTKLFDLDTYSTNQEISQDYSNEFCSSAKASLAWDLQSRLPNFLSQYTDFTLISTSLAAQAAVDLKNTNVTTFAVGIGGALQSELLAIASQPDYIFKVDSNKVTQTLKEDFIEKSCEATGGLAHPPCPNGQVVGSQCFTFNSQKMTMADAAQSCIANGGVMSEARTVAQYIQLGDIANTYQEKLWAGAEEAAEGDWRWLSNNASASIPQKWFRRGEPNNWGGNEECLQIRPDGKLNDAACGKKFAFICVN